MNQELSLLMTTIREACYGYTFVVYRRYFVSCIVLDYMSSLYLPYRDLCQTFERISDVADQFRLVLSLVHYFQLRKRLKNLALCILLYWSHFQAPYRFPRVNYLKSKIVYIVI